MPSYGGRGLAKALVSWIFPYADAENRLCFLVASPLGYPVYKKLGFQEIGGPYAVAEIDRSKWGGQGIHQHITMIRYPKGHASEAITKP
jgi:GNAT superfamily N-acetyltransferase